jgi:hypothetical protein
MSSGVTVAAIRRTCGISSSEISDADVTVLITEAEAAVERYLNTAIGAKTKIDMQDATLGNAPEYLVLSKNPILTITAITVDGTSVSPKYTKTYSGGLLQLTDNAEETTWDDSDPQNNIIKYKYGLLEESSTESTLSAAIADGSESTSYTLSITSTSGFSDDDYVKIEGTDGYREVTQLTTVGTGTAEGDIYYPHTNGSRVVKMQVPYLLKRLIEIITSEMMVARIVGESYDEIVGYGLGDMNVQKGEPYTQWRETYKQLDAERKIILKSLRPRPCVV